MNKLELAHTYAMEMASQGIKLSSCVLLGWRYAEAMLAEDEKRKDKSLPEVLKYPEFDVMIDYPDGAQVFYKGELISAHFAKILHEREVLKK